jgi:DNA mismatch repair protein MutS
VLIDELGRSSSPLDGVSLGFSVCEQLQLQVQCKVIFATHAIQMLEFSNVYPMLTRVMCARKSEDHDGHSITYEIQKLESSTEFDVPYGIDVAEAAGLPRSLIRDARMFVNELQPLCQMSSSLDVIRSDILRRLTAIKSSTLDRDELTRFDHSVSRSIASLIS